MENDYDTTSAPVSRPPTVDSSGAVPADLQSLAGNQAIADSRTQAAAIRQPLLDAKDQLLREYHAQGEVLAELERLEAAEEITEQGLAAKKEFTEKQKLVLDNFVKADADLELLDTPAATDQQLNEMLARRGSTANVAQSTETVAGDTRLGPKGLVSTGDSTTTSGLADGRSTSTTSTTTNTIDSSGWSRKTADKTTEVAGNTTSTSTKDRAFSLGAAGPGYSWGGGDETTETAKDGTTTATSNSSSSKIDASGWSKTTENSTSMGDLKATGKETIGVKRGDGKVGADYSNTKTVNGRENTTTATSGVIGGPDGVGQYGSVGKSLSQDRGGGVKTGQSMGLDGKWVADVKQIEGSDPVQYQISVTVNLGAKLGTSLAKEKEGSAGSKGDVTGSANVSASLTGTFVHVFSADDTKKYLGSLADASGGAAKELQVIKLAAQGSIADAQKLLNGAKAALLSPDGAAGMSEGDSAEIEVGGSADAKLGAGGSGGGFGLKAEGGVTAAETLKRSVSRKGGKVVIAISVATTKGWSLGGGASMEAASGSYSHASTHKAGESVTFSLDPNDPKYAANFALIADQASLDDLRQVAAEHPDLVSSNTTSSGESSTDSVTAGAAGISVGFNESHSLDKSVTKDASGVTTNLTGSTGGGASLEALGAKLSYSEKESAALQVGPGNVGSGDISKSTSETDFGASFDKLKESLTKNPLGTALGLGTGGTKVAQEKTDVAGMKLADSDFATIAAVATDPRAWAKPVASPRHFPAWQAAGRAIAGANNDRLQIADVLSRYASEHDGAADAIRSIVRTPGATEGGQQYEWPNDTGAEKAAFESLVDSDPMPPILALEQGGKNQAALDAITGKLQKLDKLAADLDGKKDQFSTSALGEMLGRLAERRRALATRSTLIARRVAAAGPEAVPTSAEPSAEDMAAGEKAGARAAFDGMLPALRGFEADQARQFQLIGAERWKRDHFSFSNPDAVVMIKAFNELRDNVYPLWDKAVDQALTTAQLAGIDQAQVKPRPAKGWCNSQYEGEFSKINFVPVRPGIDW